jgi:Ca2+-transporting ATPase
MTAGAVGLFWWEYTKALALSDSSADLAVGIAEAQTMAVTTVIMFQIFYMLNCRSLRHSIIEIGLFSNKTVFPGIGLLIVLQLVFIYAPPMHQVFGSAPLDWVDLGWSVLAGAIILPVVGVEKLLRSRAAVALERLPPTVRRRAMGKSRRHEQNPLKP